MAVGAAAILGALVLFQLKHFICDFVLQTQAQVQRKGIYGSWGGLQHAGSHAIGSIPALFVLGAAWPVIAILILIEFAIHYHTDWFKAQTDDKRVGAGQDSFFWIMFGLDQLVHQLTYIGMVAAVLYWPWS